MKELKLSELIQELSTLLDEQGDMPVLTTSKDEMNKTAVLNAVKSVKMESLRNVYYCEIS